MILLLALTLLLATVQPTPASAQPYAWPPEADAVIQTAATMWTEALPERAPLRLVVVMLEQERACSWPQPRCAAYAHRLFDGSIVIFVNEDAPWYWGLDGRPGADEYDALTMFLHEIGHGLGYSHSSDRASLMYPIHRAGSANHDVRGVIN